MLSSDWVSFAQEMIPITSLAFMRGKTIHTNEILVQLGDGWYAERSAKDALEMIARRKACNFLLIMQ